MPNRCSGWLMIRELPQGFLNRISHRGLRPVALLFFASCFGSFLSIATRSSVAAEPATEVRTIGHAESRIRPPLRDGAPSSLTSGKKSPSGKVDYNRDVRPILASKCYACHGPDEESRESGLELHIRDRAIAELDSGSVTIVPGKSGESELIARLVETDDDLRMPPSDTGEALTSDEIDLLRRWIDQGAEYADHWAYIVPTRPSPPAVANETWVRGPIDRFVISKLESAGLAPETEANRYQLIRRLSLDLIGLPPTIEEVDAFVNDQRPDAYERLVDRLLASPRYGEHWARKWLDLARYADSKGYAQDELRNIWRYRDWLIGALNRDLPYDQFTIEQLAGDMLENPTTDQLLATAFHRNTMTNTEGGTDDEEYRVAAVVDRVNTTMQVWMGITMGCAQCHTHKFDPISHHEYYQVYALLNQTADNDQPDERPTIFAPTQEQEIQLEAVRKRISQIEAQIAKEEELLKQAIPSAPEPDGPAQPVATVLKELKTKLKEAQAEAKAIERQRTPVMRELSGDKQRETHIQIRGSFLDLGEKVQPQTPAAFGLLPEGKNRDRLAFAHWLMAPENPLTARVAVNRHWEQFFGTGLVESSEDFGAQGRLPSHPELLDWLAVEFRESGWSMKELCKTIVMSATYRQSSEIAPEKLARDPNNRWYSRGARFRLSAEQIRDNALAASGLLSDKIGGASVRPPQPVSGLGASFGRSLDWKPSEGEDRYRRGLYTLIRRVSPYPSLVALGATNRTTCVIRRVRTNTPVGAFVTLNDPVFIEAAQSLARNSLSTGGETTPERIRYAFRSVLSRAPTPAETEALGALLKSTQAHYSKQPKQAKRMATEPLGPAPKGANLSELAGWTVVCNVILNLDEALTKN